MIIDDTRWIEIVSETMERGQTFFPTEKTVRPIMGSKPIIVFAAPNFLKNLRERCGFKTFSELWSEDYDRYEGANRWERIKEIIKEIINQGYDRSQAQKIVEYNYQHLTKNWLAIKNE